MWNENEMFSEMGQEYRAALHPPTRKKEKTESRVIYVQILLCALIMGAVFTLQRYAPNFYGKTYNEFQKLYEADLSREEELIRFAMNHINVQEKTAFAALPTERPFTLCSMNSKKAPAGSSLESFRPSLRFGMPVKLFDITSDYGWRKDPFSGKNTFHTGMDLAAEQGTDIYPVLSGYVRVAGYNSSYGNHLRIMHGDGTETLYAHMQYIFVAQGQNVQQTTPLGTVGQTGNTTGPHLHFELIHDDVRYDPSQALPL